MASKKQDFSMVTLGDLAKPYEEMSDEAKAVFRLAIKLANKDQDRLLKKAKEVK